MTSSARSAASRFLVVVTLCLASTAVAQTTYTVTDLGTLGGNQSIGQAINNSGQVSGFSYTTGDSTFHAFVISPPTPP